MGSDKLARLATWLAKNLQPGAQPFMNSGLRLLWSPVPPSGTFDVQFSWGRTLAANRGQWEPVAGALECSTYVFLIERLSTDEAPLEAPTLITAHEAE